MRAPRFREKETPLAYAAFSELLAAAELSGSLSASAIDRETAETAVAPAQLRVRMAETLTVMREAVATGLLGESRSRSGLTGGDAKRVAESTSGPVSGVFQTAIAAALATVEVNAAMGRIVAAPTGGASGVLPAVILTVGADRGSSEDELVDALFTAAAIGGIIAARATLSGAAGGCQAEVGSAAAMAAAAATQLCGGTPEQIGHAASLALQGLMGLVCDPVAGLVEVPCVHRNGTGCALSLAAAQMALAGIIFPVPLDEVIDAQSLVGRSLSPSLRETAQGGLAITPTGRDLAEKARRK
ncbi:MAG: L-serine ammonia-lyase, iron-sulfur-dependent, subunit alpha [Actinobacteria bacterium HGW-Actinobacteria-7]|nr:MAG: L-serine ammonia-lyase, iron-sulfur-dependent, subunit alpha [Actinobacteria bacterium HGW-Actinobacteria-7]